MCGIAGIISKEVREEDVDAMLNTISHRGPDEGGTYIDNDICMGTARLSIVDLAHGQQPICDHETGVVIAFNGEIFNFPELKLFLEKKGHRFLSNSDTEVILRLYLEEGTQFASRLNGQFGISIWDPREKVLFLTRDRFGICPLFYYAGQSEFCFSSEIKSILTHPKVTRKFDFKALDQLFTFWTCVNSFTFFEGIKEVEPGTTLTIRSSDLRISSDAYWKWPFPELQKKMEIDFSEAKSSLLEQLSSSISLRLRADVEVGSYLSGGIDSSAVVAIARKFRKDNFKTYSLSFKEDSYDEQKYQQMVAKHYHTSHKTVVVDYPDIEKAFKDVIYHNEGPIFRTAPAPLYHLSQSVREDGLKVILSGEGSDEILLGYDLLRELKIRQFWKRHPSSEVRPQLFRKLYAYLPHFSNPRYANLVSQSYVGTLNSNSPFYSHLPRWANNSANKIFFSSDFKQVLEKYDSVDELSRAMPKDFFEVGMLDRAQYLEVYTLLRGYLLSSQADRMTMANSVEGRYPFLDHELVNFASRIPIRFKLMGLKDKYILREAMKSYLPNEIINRPKVAYQAPEIRSFIGMNGSKSPLVNEHLSESSIKRTGLFDYAMVKTLLTKIEASDLTRLGVRDNMAFVQLLSTQVFFQQFFHSGPQANSKKLALKLRFGTRIRKKEKT